MEVAAMPTLTGMDHYGLRHEGDAAGGKPPMNGASRANLSMSAHMGAKAASARGPPSNASSRTQIKLHEAQSHIVNGKKLMKDCAVTTNSSEDSSYVSSMAGIGDFMDDATRLDLLAVALQDFHKALLVQEFYLGPESSEAQSTRLLILTCHANRKTWGRAGLWMLRMLREPGTSALDHFEKLHPDIMKNARAALADEQKADEAAEEEEFERAGTLYEQALQGLDRIQSLDEREKSCKKDVKSSSSFFKRKSKKNASASQLAGSVLPTDYADISTKLGQVHRVQEKWLDAKRDYRKACAWYRTVLGPGHITTSSTEQEYKSISAMVSDLGVGGDGDGHSVFSGRSLRSIKSVLSIGRKKNKKKNQNHDSDSLANDSSHGRKKGFLKKMFKGKKKSGRSGGNDDSIDHSESFRDMAQIEISVPAGMMD